MALDHRSKVLGLTALLLWLAVSSNLRAAGACGELQNAFGPYDYRDGDIDNRLTLVLTAHFTPEVEALIRGNATAYIGGDIDYTLRALPTYPRALQSMANLSLKENAAKPKGAKFTIDCYFDRAFRFRADDPMVYVVYSNFVYKQGKLEQALTALQNAEKLAPNNPNVLYNLGLLYFEKQNFDASLQYAQKAYDRKFPLSGLRDKLQRAGKWSDIKNGAEAKSAPTVEQKPKASVNDGSKPSDAPLNEERVKTTDEARTTGGEALNDRKEQIEHDEEKK